MVYNPNKSTTSPLICWIIHTVGGQMYCLLIHSWLTVVESESHSWHRLLQSYHRIEMGGTWQASTCLKRRAKIPGINLLFSSKSRCSICTFANSGCVLALHDMISIYSDSKKWRVRAAECNGWNVAWCLTCLQKQQLIFSSVIHPRSVWTLGSPSSRLEACHSTLFFSLCSLVPTWNPTSLLALVIFNPPYGMRMELWYRKHQRGCRVFYVEPGCHDQWTRMKWKKESIWKNHAKTDNNIFMKHCQKEINSLEKKKKHLVHISLSYYLSNQGNRFDTCAGFSD